MLSQEVQGALLHPLNNMNLSNTVWTLPDLNAFKFLKLSPKYIKSHCRISGRNINNIFPSLYIERLMGKKANVYLPHINAIRQKELSQPDVEKTITKRILFQGNLCYLKEIIIVQRQNICA